MGDPWPHLEVERSKVKVTRPINAETKNHIFRRRTSNLVQRWSIRWPAQSLCAETSKIKVIRRCRQSDVCLLMHSNSTTKSRRNRKMPVPRLRFRISYKVKRSKVKVVRPLWVVVQVITCRGHIVAAAKQLVYSGISISSEVILQFHHCHANNFHRYFKSYSIAETMGVKLVLRLCLFRAWRCAFC